MKILIDGFKTKEQAEEFISWYSGQGEQDADEWFDINEQPTPMTDDVKTYRHDLKNKTMEGLHWEDDTVKMFME